MRSTGSPDRPRFAGRAAHQLRSDSLAAGLAALFGRRR